MKHLILMLALIAPASAIAQDCSEHHADPVRAGDRRVVVVPWYLSPVSHYVDRDSAVAEVPVGAVLVSEGGTPCGEFFLTEWRGARGYMLAYMTISYADAVRNGVVILSSESAAAPPAPPMAAYPNPAPGRVTLEADGAAVFDALGRRIARVNGRRQMDLPPGAYFLRSGSGTRSFIVQ